MNLIKHGVICSIVVPKYLNSPSHYKQMQRSTRCQKPNSVRQYPDAVNRISGHSGCPNIVRDKEADYAVPLSCRHRIPELLFRVVLKTYPNKLSRCHGSSKLDPNCVNNLSAGAARILIPDRGNKNRTRECLQYTITPNRPATRISVPKSAGCKPYIVPDCQRPSTSY